MAMDLHKILKNLCYYDKRNPDSAIDEDGKPRDKKECFCDNCFHGRTELAEEILKHLEKTQEDAQRKK